MAAQAQANQNAPGSYVSLSDLTTAGKLAQKRKESEQLRQLMKRDWALNRSFYNGQQWSFWNPQMMRVEDIPIDSGPRWKVRLTSNQIKPGLSHYVAQLTKTRPVITAEPDSGSDTDIKAAQMAESLYDYLWDDKQMNELLKDALMEAGLSGGYWKISWDPLAGKPMTFILGPDDQPIMDEELAEVYVDQLQQQLAQSGVPPEAVTQLADQLSKKTVYLGDIKIDVMTAENVLLDPSANRFDEAKWAICRHTLDPDEIKARFGVTCSPNAVKSDDTPPPFTEDKKPAMTLREVFIMYIKPCPAVPDGRYVAWIEGPNQILQDTKWPYPFRDLPLVKFPGLYRPNSPYDDAIVTDARSIQKDLNKTLSQIVEHKNLTVRPQLLAPVGSLRTKLTSEPGAVFEYNPVGQAVPQWREMPNLPPYVFDHLQGLQVRLDRLFNRTPSTRDQLPARADSGDLVESMQEAVADQLSPVILGIEDALARAGHLIAAYAQAYYEEPRLLKIRGAGGSVQVRKFEAADIAGGFTFRPRYGTGLPRSREGKRQAIMQMLQMQLIDAQTAMKHLDLADLKGVQAKLAADEDQAFREHDKMLRGQVINPAAMRSTQQQIQQMIQTAQAGQPVLDPQSGQPIDPQMLPQQFQQMMQSAANAPTDYEDWNAHLDVHGSFMKTAEFESYPEDVQDRFLDHFNQTYQRVMDIRKAQMAFDPKLKPRVTIQTRGTVSAPVLGEVLREQGVDVSDDAVAQPPLDTWVAEDLSKGNVDASGNSQPDPVAQAAELQQAQDAHITAQADAAQQMALAGTRAAVQEHQGQLQINRQQQQMQQAHEAHQQKLRHAEQIHQARMRAAQRTRGNGGNKQ